MRTVTCDLEPSAHSAGVPAHTGPYDLVVVGASFGGPPAVEDLLRALPRDYPSPVVICQHIVAGFTKGWAERLDEHCKLQVLEAANTQKIEPGRVYIAPSGFQTRVGKGALGGFFRVQPDFADSLYVPSIDMLMSSAAQTFGSHTLAALLTGLGSDGACGMLAVREAGGYTIAESAATAKSFSMPESAMGVGGVVEMLPIQGVIRRIVELGSVRPGKR